MRRLAGAALLALLACPAQAQRLPAKPGQCVETSISRITTRLVSGARDEPVPGSGSAVSFANGGYQVSYDTVAGIEASRVGDAVRLCLVSIPTGCPPRDRRGRVYQATNLRTGASWTLPDAEHMCGGA